MRVGAFIIDAEFLRGERQDRHLAKLIELLHARGMSLHWALHVDDDRALLIEALRRSLASPDLVFCFGGSGTTADDPTAQAAAAALGVPLVRHPDAVAQLEARFGAELYPRRARLAEVPLGSAVVAAPRGNGFGFRLYQHYFVPAPAELGWPLVEWVLDTQYAHLRDTRQHGEPGMLAPGNQVT